MRRQARELEVLLYHNRSRVVRCKLWDDGSSGALTVPGPMVYPRDTQLEVEVIGTEHDALRPQRRFPAVVIGCSKTGLRLTRVEPEDAVFAATPRQSQRPA
jgi:hypothetical protein